MKTPRSLWHKLFLISSFGIGLGVGVLLYQEVCPEWIWTQISYNRRLAEVTGDKSKAFMMPQVKQIYLPQMMKTDRCITCHAGIDNAKMAGQPQPFGSHPDLGIPGFLEKHPFTEMGCTICHYGQGSATTKKHAHGPVHHWEQPLLPSTMIAGTCATCHQNTNGLKGAEKIAEARKLFEEKGCIGCHNVHGKGMLVGPELAETFGKSTAQFDFRFIHGGLGEREDETVHQWVEEHFRDPQKVVPGYKALGIPETPMPNYGLSEEQIQMLTALVLNFYSEEEKDEQPIPAKFKVGTPPAEEHPVYASTVEEGAALFQKFGCVACHGPQGRGGVRNKNMDAGEEVPTLVYVGSGYTKEQIKDIIRNGRYPGRSDKHELSPAIWMPSWKEKLTDEQIDALADYLISLQPS